jgi:hypothetical protein
MSDQQPRDLPAIVRDTLIAMAAQVERDTRAMNSDDPDFSASVSLSVRLHDITITAGWQWTAPDTDAGEMTISLEPDKPGVAGEALAE